MSEVDVSKIEEGRAILFLGAGFSAEATNFRNEKIKDVSGLLKQLLTEINKNPDGYDLESASEAYVKHFGVNGDAKLIELLHGNFRSKSATDNQIVTVCQPWYRIYTSNYDDLVERIGYQEGKSIIVKEITDPVSRPLKDVTQLVHIYGNITKSSPDEFRKKFLLTESQRDNSPFLKSSWFRRFYDDVLTASAIYFVGFSLSDIDLRRLLGSLPAEVRK